MAEHVKSRKAKVKISKNKKKGWRKHADISDVEQHLEDRRQEERAGGLVSEKPDSSLFFIEKSASKNVEKPRKTEKLKDIKLKCFSNLEPDPRVKPGYLGRFKQTATLKQKVEHTQCKNRLYKNSKERRGRRNKAKSPPRSVIYDIWGAPEQIPDVAAVQKLEEFYAISTKRKLPAPPDHLKTKPSKLAAVIVPHAGASYNPAYDDHQELLRQAVNLEEEKIKITAKIDRATTEMFPTKDEAPTEETWLREMSEGLNSAGKETTTKCIDQEDFFIPAVKKNERKPKKKRNMEIKEKALGSLKAKLKEERVRKNAIYNLRSIKKEIFQEERTKQERQNRKAQKQLAKINDPKRIGRMKYRDPELEVKLSSELVGSLRQLKPESSLLEDRFKSLQKRSIIEPRERSSIVRKYKRKTYEKASHKSVTVS